jgi:hypothetical protein
LGLDIERPWGSLRAYDFSDVAATIKLFTL